MPPVSDPRLDLVKWMAVLRRIAVLGVGCGLLFLGPEPGLLVPLGATLVAVAVYNEAGRWLAQRRGPAGVHAVAHAEVALDALVIVVVLHHVGSTSFLSVALAAVPFYAAGALLPLGAALGHVWVMALELLGVAIAQEHGWLAAQSGGLFPPGLHMDLESVLLPVASITIINWIFACAGHYMNRLLEAQERRGQEIAAERSALLAENNREAERARALLASNERVYGRVRALLDVAQHVSGTHSVDDLLRAVCDTTVALVRVPRVEIFLWDGKRKLLQLAAARGLAREGGGGEERQYPADFPIVAQLRAGEVVDFGAGPNHSLMPATLSPPFRRGFAAPMVCRGSFEGALFVGYDGENADELKELVQGVARQAAVALVNVRALERQQEDADVSRGLLEISQALSACLDEGALWTLLAQGTREVLGLEWALALGFDDEQSLFRFAALSGAPKAVADGVAEATVRLEDFPVLQELLSQRELLVADESHRQPLDDLPRPFQQGSWLAIPLFRGGWVAGFLVAGTGDRRNLSSRQLRLAEGLGHHASIALQNARLVANLEAADRLKSDFVATMSHEVRTPLNVIIGYTEMLREHAVGPVTAEQLDVIQRLDARGRELLELIEAILHVGRVEAGRDSAEIAPIQLADLLAVLRASTEGLPRPAGVAFDFEAPAALPGPVMTDRAKLALVVRNLVSNAFKFTAEGKVVLRLFASGDDVVIEVSDTGIGIGAEHLPIIFDMFRQVDGSMTRRHGGVGLGLYIVKQFVTRLGGAVTVTSVPGEGSTFRVVLRGAVRTAGQSGRGLAAA